MDIPALPEPPKLSRFVVTAVLAIASYILWPVLLTLLTERPGKNPDPTGIQLLYEKYPLVLPAVVPAIISVAVLWWALKEAKRFYAQAVEHSNSTTAAIASAVEAHMEAGRKIDAIKARFEAKPEVRALRYLEGFRSAICEHGPIPASMFFELLAPDFAKQTPKDELIERLARHLKIEHKSAEAVFEENIGACLSQGLMNAIERSGEVGRSDIVYYVLKQGQLVLGLIATGHSRGS